MVYKKYIKKNGKIYGPYIYHSRRVDGKVISNYHGKGKEGSDFFNYKSYLLVFVCLILIILGFLFFNNYLTGKATLKLDSSFEEGQTLFGNLKFTLVQGEFLPAGTMVIAKIGNKSYASSLDKLIDIERVAGDYFIEGKSLVGRGGGYGYGDKYPEVSFVLDVYLQDEYREEGEGEDLVNETEIQNQTISRNETISNETISNETVSENETIEFSNETETQGEVIANETEEIPEEIEINSESEEIVSEEIKIEDNKETSVLEEETSLEETNEESTITGAIIKSFLKLSNSFFGLTGNAVLGKEVHANVSYGSPYVYNMTRRQTAKIISSTEKVKLKIEEDQAIVTTDYKGPNKKEFSIDLSKLNITAKEGDLEIKFVYSNTEILSITEKIGKEKTLEENLSEENETLQNFTFVNETVTNETLVVNGSLIEINTTQYTAVINKPVKWKKNVKGNFSGKVSVELPKEAENISVYAINGKDDSEDIEEDISENNLTIEVNESKKGKEEKNESGKEKKKIPDDKITITGKTISGEISAELDLEEEKSFFDFLKSLFNKLTGKIIDIQETEEVKEVIISENATEFEIEYETPAPVSIEENTTKGKNIIISSEFHYENVLAYTELPREVPEYQIKLYHIENGSKELTNFNSYDENNNSLVDYIEWVVPHLSNQSYELIIEIIKAEHLDENRSFISDIYNEVKAKDNNWSEEINNGEFVRVTFEKKLDSSRDITIFARGVNGSSTNLEVFVKDRNNSIATFENINNESWYKIYLTDLEEAEDVFDLKINGSIEFDYIVDPITLIEFISPPTPSNDTATSNQSQEINVSINGDLGEFKWNWNKTNYTLFNDSLALMLNLDNISSLGENDTYFVDASGKGNNATGGAFDLDEVVGGKYGNAVNFDGTNDYVVTNTIDFSGTDKMTVSFWVRPNAAIGGSNLMLVELSDNTNSYIDSFWINIDTPGGESQSGARGDVGYNVWGMSTPLTVGSWNFIVYTYDKGLSSGEVKGYFNGVLDGSTITNNDNTNNFGNRPFYIASRAGTTEFFNGSIDELVIFNRSLSAEEIAILYMSNLNKYDIDKWSFYINQTKNATGLLDYGSYTYYASAKDSLDNENMTEERTLIIEITPPSLNRFEIENSSGDNIAIFDDSGNCYLSGTTNENQGTLSHESNSFIVENSSGDVISYIDSLGSLYLLGSVFEFSDLSGKTPTNLEFRNSTDNLIAFFDNAGNIRLKGSMFENYLDIFSLIKFIVLGLSF